MQQRGRSSSPSRLRGRSKSPSQRMPPRGRSGSPSRMRGRSSDERMKAPASSRSCSPSQKSLPTRGRSSSPGGKSRSRSRSAEGAKDSVRRGGKRKAKPKPKGEKPSRGRFNHKRISHAVVKAPKKVGRAMKKAPRKTGRYVKHKGQQIKQRIAPNQSCPFWKVCAYVLPFFIIIGCSIGLIRATGSGEKFTPTFVANLIPKLDGKDVVDPYSGSGSTSVAKWNNGDSSGLEIELLNSMEPTWAQFFSVVLSDYEFGSPDALTLSDQQVTVDKDCKPVAGMLLVWFGKNSPSLGSSF
jgi:hypothetical protein